MPGVKKVVQVGGGVEALDLAAHHRAFLDRGVEHAGQLEIRTVDLLALERHVFRRLELGGGFRHLAVGSGAAGGTYHAES